MKVATETIELGDLILSGNYEALEEAIELLINELREELEEENH